MVKIDCGVEGVIDFSYEGTLVGESFAKPLLVRVGISDKNRRGVEPVTINDQSDDPAIVWSATVVKRPFGVSREGVEMSGILVIYQLPRAFCGNY